MLHDLLLINQFICQLLKFILNLLFERYLIENIRPNTILQRVTCYLYGDQVINRIKQGKLKENQKQEYSIKCPKHLFIKAKCQLLPVFKHFLNQLLIIFLFDINAFDALFVENKAQMLLNNCVLIYLQQSNFLRL